MRDWSRSSRNTLLIIGIPAVLVLWFAIVDRERVRWLWTTQRVDVGGVIESIIDWLTDTFSTVFSFIRDNGTTLITNLADALNWFPPVAFALIAALLALALRAVVLTRPYVDTRGLVKGLPFAVFTFVSFRFVDAMNLWTLFLSTFALILVATILAVGVAIPVGIAAAHHQSVSVLVRPVLDFMQTLPVFVYLLPALAFFRVGIVAGLFATLIFAIPPGVRLTELGLRHVDREVVEAAEAYGASKRQLLWGVKMPLALPSIMQGVNQVIMLALSMVVVAALVGAGGLGTPVVAGVQRLEIGNGFEGGFAVVVLAIFLDRLTSILRERSVVEE